MAVLLLLGSGCIPGRFCTTSIETWGIDGDSLYGIVDRTSGTTVTRPGPCPQEDFYPKRRRLYLLRYDLHPGGSNPLRPTVQFLERQSIGSGRDRHLPRSAYVAKLPEGVVLRLADAPPSVMQRLGDPDRNPTWGVYRYRDRGSTCILQFQTLGDRGAEVECTDLAKRASPPLDVNYGCILDPNASRLVVLEDTIGSPLIGLPRSIVIWHYRTGEEERFLLDQIEPDTVVDLAD